MKQITLIFSAILMLCAVRSNAQDLSVVELNYDTLQENSGLTNVAFRAIDRQDLLGGVSVIDITDLVKKSYATGSLDHLEEVVGGFNGNIWGMDEYLVLVDGFPRDANNVLPSEIEQIVLLKGASNVVLFGSQAAKGVIKITTKRGRAGEKLFNIRANTGFHVPKVYPKYLGSAEYMTLYNEALVNDGLLPNFSEEQIYNHGSGVNPYRYPDIDLYSSDYLSKAYNRSEAIVEVAGGSDIARFYTTTGYYTEGSLLKLANGANNNINRFFLRGNIDVKLHESLTAFVDANASFYNSRTANITDRNPDDNNTENYWTQASSMRPHRFAPLIPIHFIEGNDETSLGMINASNYLIDGRYFLGGTQLDPTNPIADLYAAGENNFVSRQFQFNGGVNWRIQKGLFFRTKYGVDYATTYDLSYINEYATYQPLWTSYTGQDLIGSINQFGIDRKTGEQIISNNGYRSTNFWSGQFDYTTSINNKHNIFAMALANGWQRQMSGEYHKLTNINLGFQASYNFDRKYYIDFSAALPYSAKLPEDNRLGFSPTAALGWRLTNEPFLSESSLFDDLMLSVSGGIIETDMDISTDGNEMGYYLYKQILDEEGWWSWGDLGGEPASGFDQSENPYLTYIKRKELNVGLRGSLLDRKLIFNFNYFMNQMDGGVLQASTIYPMHFVQIGYPASSFLPFVNYNQDDRTGFDFSVYWNQNVGEVDLTLGVNGMYYKATAARRDEIVTYDYQAREGRPMNGLWGLESLGFFEDDADIAASPAQSFGDVQPGDIKYKDQNGDNIIDSNDEVYLNRWDDPLSFGVNLTAQWRNFTLFAMGNGHYGGYGYKDNSYWWVRGENKYSEVVRDRWTEETKATATYPRLTTTNGDNNFRNSDFWMYDRTRFSLTQVQVTYDLPDALFNQSLIKGISAYLGGYNLLTVAKESEYLEMNVGSAPQTRFYNVGLNFQF